MKRSILYNYTKEELQKIVDKSLSIKDFMRKIGFSSEGANRKTIYRVFKEYEINLTQLEKNRKIFLEEHRRTICENSKIPIEEILIENSTFNRGHLKERLIKENLLEYKCIKCSNEGSWQNEKLVLVLDHINGINNDNRLENLRFLCPNCNSQTKTFCGKNQNKDLEKQKKRTKKIKINSIKFDKTYNYRISILKEIDINKFGWVNEVAKKWGVSHAQTKRWIRKYCPEFSYYQRKSPKNNGAVV